MDRDANAVEHDGMITTTSPVSLSVSEFEQAALLTALPNGTQKRLRRRTVAALLAGLDLSAIFLAFTFASFFRLGELHAPQVSNILFAITPIYFGIALNNNGHNARIAINTGQSIQTAAMALLFAAGSMILIAFFMKVGSEFSRLLFGLGTISGIILISAFRWGAAIWAVRYLGSAPYANLWIFDGVPTSHANGHYAIQAANYGLRPNPADPGSVHKLAALVEGMDRVVVHCAPERREAWAFTLKALDIPSELAMPELAVLKPLGIAHRSTDVTLLLGSGHLRWNQMLMKRAFDLVVTVLALPIVIPILLLTAIAIKFDSKGSILFRQRRIGLGNRPFDILKFRSMHADQCDPDGAVSTGRTDQRITRVGKFIRATSIDELPQIVNVLKGEMSIVGPRPHAADSRAENLLFWDIDHRYWHRHAVKPGLTGLAQVRGFRGSTEMKSDLSNRLQADLEYVAAWSLTNDVRIIFRTFIVLIHKNAF